MKFSYTALGQDQQKITGILEAESLEMAQAELQNKKQLTVVAIKPEIVRQDLAELSKKTSQTISTFYFVAQNKEGKEVNGTIDASDAFQAYQRLLYDYQFKILELTEYDDGIKEEMSFKSKFAFWNELLRTKSKSSPTPKIIIKKEMEEQTMEKNREGQKIQLDSTHETRGNAPKTKKSTPSFWQVTKKYFERLKTSNPILKNTKKQELEALLTLRRTQAVNQNKAEQPPIAFKTTKDFTSFFMELDSFVSWLIFFYLVYFFLASFSLERTLGLPQDLVLKTLSSPLILNIFIFLMVAHLAFTLKIRWFRQNALGTFFLFFLCFGSYTFLILNF